MDNNHLSQAAAIEDQAQEFMELRHVNVARGERVVLQDVNLKIRTWVRTAAENPR
jgi:ABC-type molybdenum transport system ATPase subunit/photorepair protein PhrA